MTNDLAIKILMGDVLGTTVQTHEAVAMAVKALSALPSADAVEVVRCKDCKYRPYLPEGCDPNGSGGVDLVFPDELSFKCPCQCDDSWYSYIPEDDWFCANGERRTECD